MALMRQTPQDRYRFKPFIGSSHSWALQQLSSFDKNTAILDIGAGGGIIGQNLQAAGYNNLSAVEVDSDARNHIRGFYRQTVAEIKELEGQCFDLIIMLDVIEHLAEPFQFFKQAIRFLNPGGTLLLSVPNIAHWSVRLELLAGRFEYRDNGILDRTHLQFFTRKRLLELIAESPILTADNITASIAPLELLCPAWLWDNSLYRAASRVRLELASLWPGLLAYQHLAVIRRK